MQSPLGLYIRLVGIFLVFEKTNVSRRAINPNGGVPPIARRISGNAKKAAFGDAFGATLILHIDLPCHIAQIRYTVICTVSVDVIYLNRTGFCGGHLV